MLYFYLGNGSNVWGLEFNYKNGEEEGDSGLGPRGGEVR